MSIIAKESGSPRELIPAGNVQAVCYGVIELGHRDGNYGVKHEAVVLFEIPSLRFEDEDGKDLPRGINNFYGISLHEKSNMGKDLASWRGKAFTPQEKEGFDITALIGANCLLNIAHVPKADKSMRDKIASITPLMQGMAKLQPENSLVNYSISDNGFNFDGVPEWAVKFIKESEEYKADKNPPVRADNEPPIQEPPADFDTEDSIPF